MRHAGYHRMLVTVLMAVRNTVTFSYPCTLSTYAELRMATNNEQAHYN